MLILSRSDQAAEQRETFLRAASKFFEQARQVAEDGEISKAGSLILKALDQERRAGSAGPQVLQLIKPRS